MNLLGKFKFGGEPYFLYLQDTKQKEVFTLISSIHAEDRIHMIQGEELQHPTLQTMTAVYLDWDVGYVMESIERRKRTGKVYKFGVSNILMNVMDAITKVKSYHFQKEQVQTQEKLFVDGVERENFVASDERIHYSFHKMNGLYTYLHVQSDTLHFELNPMNSALNLKGIVYEELQHKKASKVAIANLKKITFQDLIQKLDMSWYQVNGKVQKEYIAITSNEEFEEKIMTPMLKKIAECQEKGISFDVAVDTETTGLYVYNLSDGNPIKDHCVAIPICWEFGKSFVIYTDMQHFSNADNEYVVGRLAELFEKFQGEREIVYWEDEEEVLKPPNEFQWRSSVANVFDAGSLEGNEICGKETRERQKIRKTIRIQRNSINLIGHNSGFDGRVFFSLGKKFYFNQDTLQMAFDINPQSVRGSKKLKVLTRFFYGAETPELEDVLGRGNEDKYKYLEDDEVARIYGCADADYTLGIFYKLKALMPKTMYYWYQRQDIPMINILYQSEYWGMRTIAEEVQKLGEQTKHNIEILKQTMYEYVGVYIKYTKEMQALKAIWDAGGFDSEESYEEAKKRIVPDFNAVYEFEFKPAQLKNVLYGIMKYPVKAYTEGKTRQAKLDKYVVKKLLQEKLEEGEHRFKTLEKDILVYGADEAEYQRLREEQPKKAESMCLISAKEFNSYRYPLALIIKKYSELQKEYTAYYKPLEEQNLEGKIFKGYNLARIETRRILNPGQTMKGNLKALIRAYSDDDYMLDFDMSQVEQRIMVSLSGYSEMIERMKNPEKDAHTETASMVEGKPPYMISKKERKNAKSVTFGLPYGLGVRSLCETIFGDTLKEHLLETRIIIDKWKKGNKPIVDFLEQARYEALKEWKISDELRDFMGMWQRNEEGEFVLGADGKKLPIPISRVTNILGFYRVFNLTGVGQTKADFERRAQGDFTAEESSIRRKSGNYPIQATASELFRQILIRFYEACEKYGIGDKVKWHMLIHDELLCSVSKDVHPFLLYKIVKEACMVTLKGHTQYYVGINVGDTWAQCKDDNREAPVRLVNQIIKRWDAGEFQEGRFEHPWDFIRPYLDKYFEERIGEVIKSYQPDADRVPIDLAALLKEFSNYTVRAYVNKYSINGSAGPEPNKTDPDAVANYDNLVWIKKLESWALDYYGEGKEFLGLDGVVYKVTRQQGETEKREDFIDYEELFNKENEMEEDDEDNYWSWDDESAGLIFNSESKEELQDKYEGEEELQFSLGKPAQNVTDLTVIKSKYRNLKMINSQLFISVNLSEQASILKQFLSSEIVNIGTRVVFKIGQSHDWWQKIRANYDLIQLDAFLEFLKSKEEVYVMEDQVIVRMVNRITTRKLTSALQKYEGKDYKLSIVCYGNLTKSISFSKRVSLNKLEQLVKKLNEEANHGDWNKRKIEVN